MASLTLRPGTAPRTTLSELAKATIINTITGEAHPVMYNPEELRLEQGNVFAEVGIPGLDASPTQYVRGRGRTLSMELFFDTYSTHEDVRTYTAAVVRLLDKVPQEQAPPVLLFSLGRIQLRCVLVDAAQRFTMFLRDGTPVRSTLSVRLQEYVRGDVEIRQGFYLGSPTLSAAATAAVSAARDVVTGSGTVHVVVDGETLSSLAGLYLGDVARWREIAQANNIDDPLVLRPGAALVVPAPGQGGRPRTAAGP